MIACDATAELSEWLERQRAPLDRRKIATKIKRGTDIVPPINKAGLVFECDGYAATVTLWGNGMLELICLRVSDKRDVIVDHECQTRPEIHDEIDAFVERFAKDETYRS